MFNETYTGKIKQENNGIYGYCIETNANVQVNVNQVSFFGEDGGFMKKTKKVLFIIPISLLLVIIVAAVLCFLLLDGIRWSGSLPKFKEYQKDYETIASVALKELKEADGKEAITLLLLINPYALSNICKEPTKRLSLTKEEQQSLKNIYTLSFHMGSGDNFAGIHIEASFLTFESENGKSTIVFSYEGKNPKKEYPRNDGLSYKFKKVSENWYYVSTRSSNSW